MQIGQRGVIEERRVDGIGQSVIDRKQIEIEEGFSTL